MKSVPSLLAAATAALCFASGAIAADKADAVSVAEAGAEAGQARGVQLVSWNGDFELLKTSRRLKIWRSHLAYRMEVDAQGRATDCEVIDEFRRAYLNEKLCDILIEHSTFAPAQDASGAPIAGDYVARISYMDLRERP